jgi:hypothetical protein
MGPSEQPLFHLGAFLAAAAPSGLTDWLDRIALSLDNQSVENGSQLSDRPDAKLGLVRG